MGEEGCRHVDTIGLVVDRLFMCVWCLFFAVFSAPSVFHFCFLWNSFVSSAFNVLWSFSNDIDTNKTTPKNNEYSRRPEASGGFSGQLHSDNNSDDTLAEDILSERKPMMKHWHWHWPDSG